MSDQHPAAYVAGIDIGGTNTRFAVAARTDLRQLLGHRSAPTPIGTGIEAFLDFVATEMDTCLRAAGIDRTAVAATGVSSPGVIDAKAGVVLTASNLAWDDLPLAALLSERLGMPVAIENDVKIAALAEYHAGAGRGRSPLVYFTISTGVAVGIVVDGQVFRGRHHAAGEIAYLLGEPAHIGQDWMPNGCLELNAAGVGLARIWDNAHTNGDRRLTAADIFGLARQGDPEASALVRQAADYLAMSSVAIGTLIDPDLVVFGGSIAQHEPWILDRIRQVVDETLPFPFEIAPALLGGEAPLIGALALADTQR